MLGDAGFYIFFELVGQVDVSFSGGGGRGGGGRRKDDLLLT